MIPLKNQHKLRGLQARDFAIPRPPEPTTTRVDCSVHGDANHRGTLVPWYAVCMLRGVFQRAAVAIVLMGGLLAPNGICLQPTPHPAHSCCAPAPESTQFAQTECCTARAPLPAVVVAPDVPAPAPMSVAVNFVPVLEFSSRDGFPSAAIIPHLSPPTGAFNLRI